MQIMSSNNIPRSSSALRARPGRLGKFLLTSSLALGLVSIGPAPTANAATITVSGFGYTVTVCCSTVTANSGGLSCAEACSNIDSNVLLSCTYNPMNGTVTITQGALAYVERTLESDGGVINVQPGGGALLSFEPDAGEMTLAAPHPGMNIVVITGDGAEYTTGKDGTVTFPLADGAQASVLNNRPLPPNGQAKDADEGDPVLFSNGGATCDAVSGGGTKPSTPTPKEKAAQKI